MQIVTRLCHESDPEKRDVNIKALQASWEYLSEEVPAALNQSKEGLRRIIKIVSAMKTFSRPASSIAEPVNINDNIESTATVAANADKKTLQINSFSTSVKI